MKDYYGLLFHSRPILTSPSLKSHAKFSRVCSQSSTLWRLRSCASGFPGFAPFQSAVRLSWVTCQFRTENCKNSKFERTSGGVLDICRMQLGIVSYVNVFEFCEYMHVFPSCPMCWIGVGVGEYLQLSGWENSNYSQLLLLCLQIIPDACIECIILVGVWGFK